MKKKKKKKEEIKKKDSKFTFVSEMSQNFKGATGGPSHTIVELNRIKWYSTFPSFSEVSFLSHDNASLLRLRRVRSVSDHPGQLRADPLSHRDAEHHLMHVKITQRCESLRVTEKKRRREKERSE